MLSPKADQPVPSDRNFDGHHVLITTLGPWFSDYETIWLEASMITLFAVFWLIQTHELWHAACVPPRCRDSRAATAASPRCSLSPRSPHISASSQAANENGLHAESAIGVAAVPGGRRAGTPEVVQTLCSPTNEACEAHAMSKSGGSWLARKLPRKLLRSDPRSLATRPTAI